MALADDVRALRDRAEADLKAAHDYYVEIRKVITDVGNAALAEAP